MDAGALLQCPPCGTMSKSDTAHARHTPCMRALPQAAPVVDEVHMAVQRAPVQQAVRPVEPGVVQQIQRGHRGQHIQRLHGHAPGDIVVITDYLFALPAHVAAGRCWRPCRPATRRGRERAHALAGVSSGPSYSLLTPDAHICSTSHSTAALTTSGPAVHTAVRCTQLLLPQRVCVQAGACLGARQT